MLLFPVLCNTISLKKSGFQQFFQTFSITTMIMTIDSLLRQQVGRNFKTSSWSLRGLCPPKAILYLHYMSFSLQLTAYTCNYVKLYLCLVLHCHGNLKKGHYKRVLHL